MSKEPIDLPRPATLADCQRYVNALEEMHGWLDVDLVRNCFLMGEEMGELFRAVRDYENLASDAAREHVGDEIVDVLNYLLALANRLNIDLDQAFRAKNRRNEGRTWP